MFKVSSKINHRLIKTNKVHRGQLILVTMTMLLRAQWWPTWRLQKKLSKLQLLNRVWICQKEDQSCQIKILILSKQPITSNSNLSIETITIQMTVSSNHSLHITITLFKTIQESLTGISQEKAMLCLDKKLIRVPTQETWQTLEISTIWHQITNPIMISSTRINKLILRAFQKSLNKLKSQILTKLRALFTSLKNRTTTLRLTTTVQWISSQFRFTSSTRVPRDHRRRFTMKPCSQGPIMRFHRWPLGTIATCNKTRGKITFIKNTIVCLSLLVTGISLCTQIISSTLRIRNRNTTTTTEATTQTKTNPTKITTNSNNSTSKAKRTLNWPNSKAKTKPRRNTTKKTALSASRKSWGSSNNFSSKLKCRTSKVSFKRQGVRTLNTKWCRSKSKEKTLWCSNSSSPPNSSWMPPSLWSTRRGLTKRNQNRRV